MLWGLGARRCSYGPLAAGKDMRMGFIALFVRIDPSYEVLDVKFLQAVKTGKNLQGRVLTTRCAALLSALVLCDAVVRCDERE